LAAQGKIFGVEAATGEGLGIQHHQAGPAS
jgi:hypothetical protein